MSAMPYYTAITPYYADDAVTIYHADALEIMRALGPDACDIVVTSPPYNMGLTPGGNGRGMYPHTTQKARRFGDGYESSSDSLDHETYCEWQRVALAAMGRCARHAVFYNHRPRVMHGALHMPLDGDYGPIDMALRQIITWDRGTGIDVNLNHFCTRGEWIMLFARPTFRLVDHAASGMGDVWNLGMDYSGVHHPAPFPISLPMRCIAASGADLILDPFMGSGTTLRAAKDLGRRAIGVDISEQYCELAARRMGQEVLAL